MSARDFERMSVEGAWALLQYVRADDRDLWVKVGGIIKDEFGDAAFSIWDEWSQTSGSYIEKDGLSVWKSLGNNSKRAGIGTLVYLAREGGWSPAANAPETAPTPRAAPPPGASTSAYAAHLWLASSFDDAVVGSHPYPVKKGINWAAGAGRGSAAGKLIGHDADCVIVPIRTDGTGKLQGVQCINAESVKQTFGAVNGGCLVLGNTRDTRIPWYVAEGWASAVSVVFHHHHGNAVCAVAFGKHNLMPAAQILSRVFIPREVIVLQEQD